VTGQTEPWHLDKRVPVALILALCVQTGTAIWWAAGLSADVAVMQARQDRQETAIEATRTTANQQAVQLGRIEENTRATQAAVERLLRQMEDR
jgi:Tfp pilus assembly protein PilO